jgi:hypothetical protein
LKRSFIVVYVAMSGYIAISICSVTKKEESWRARETSYGRSWAMIGWPINMTTKEMP